MESQVSNIWVRTHFAQVGDFLEATTYLVAAGQPEVFRCRVDLRPIAKWAAEYHKKLHAKGGCAGCDPATDVAGCVGCDCVGEDCIEVGGWWKSLKKTVKRVGKSKLLKSISRGVKVVLKSKAVAAMTAGVAVVFPPVGVPAAAALASANVALSAIDAADRDAKAIRNVVRAKKTVVAAKAAVKGGVKLGFKAKLKAAIAAKTLARGRLVLGKPTVRKAIVARKETAKTARDRLKAIAETARYGDTAEDRAEARKAAAVINIAASLQARLKQISGQAAASGLTGLVITADGRVVKGKKWFKRGAGRAMLLEPTGTITRGQFEAVVGGCYGCTYLH